VNSDRFFTKKHEWIEVLDDKTTGIVGISSYAQEALGDVVFVQLPEVEDKVNNKYYFKTNLLVNRVSK